MMPTGIPPGFRFHPTEEELLFYYLRKKVLYEAIDLDVIREIDLNRHEPWDLKDKCRIGTDEHQNDWYFFSHKDKKYPTGTRTNRATAAGFWKATGRDKSVHMTNTSKTIGMRKTLVFYTGRAPHGHKTDWIMHEYRLNTEYNDGGQVLGQENGWVVCRVFTKKNHSIRPQDKAEAGESVYMKPSTKYHLHHQRAALYDFDKVDNSKHLPLLLYGQDQTPYYIPPLTLSNMDTTLSFQQERLSYNNGDWLFLDKLLASNTNMQDYDQKQMAL